MKVLLKTIFVLGYIFVSLFLITACITLFEVRPHDTSSLIASIAISGVAACVLLAVPLIIIYD